MLGSTVEKERLRSLVGLDTRMNSDFHTGNAQGRTDLPDSLELLSLLQKHDQLVAELYQELESCKNDLSLVKEQSTSQFEQTRRIFDELRAQIISSNLGKDSLQSTQIVVTAGGAVSLRAPQGLNGHICPNCRELQDYVFRIEKDNKKLQTCLLDCESELNQLRRQDAKYLDKVRESISVADRAVVEKNETLVRMKQTHTRIETLEKELKESLCDHDKALEQCRKSIQSRYEGEVEALKHQLHVVSKSEAELKSKMNILIQERDELTSERGMAKQRSSEKKKEIDEQLHRLRNENTSLSRANKQLTNRLADMEKETNLRTVELSEKIQNLDHQLKECRSNLDNSKSMLNVTKKENTDLRERYAMTEKEVWQLRKWKQWMEKQTDETIKRKELEMKEAVRVAELKHDQTKMELERLLNNQNGLIFRLKEECKLLTDQLERVAKRSRSGRRLENHSSDTGI